MGSFFFPKSENKFFGLRNLLYIYTVNQTKTGRFGTRKREVYSDLHQT
jgi:hypothetical protein